MMKQRFRIAGTAAAGVLAMGLLAACGSGDSGSATGGGGGESKELSVPIAAGWDEDIAVSHLWKYALEQKGYTVELPQVDIGPAFAGVAKGDFDLFFDTWLPTTHEDYWNQYQDQVEDIGVWYDKATLNIAVPEYVDAKTIGDLQGMASTFDGTITGIDSGAGLTRVTREEAMPTYGLEDYTLRTSSTTAMLSALQKATQAQEPIVVTLWHPHWAYSAYPIKDLEDPEGAMGGAEEIHVIGRDGFGEEFPELNSALQKFTIDDKTLASLENTVLQEHDDPAAGAEAWAKENQDFVNQMTQGISGS
jgi:glycine betaine/proline transport system substrate-binding protein